VQEHFAALALRDLAEQEWEAVVWEKLQRAGQRLLTGQRQGLFRLAADDWCTETFVQLAGLIDNSDRLAREVARANPWLAWWCVEEGRAVEDDTRIWVEDRSVELLYSKRTSDRRRAVQALARIQRDRTLDPLFEAAADPDAEIAGLAVQALISIGEAARRPVMKALQGTDRRLWRAALRYLATQADDPLCSEIPTQVWEGVLGQPMVWVPGGPFLMGSNKAHNPKADDNELPQHTVTLPGYWIGRYPVTAAHFRKSVTQSGPRYHPVVGITWYGALAYCRRLAGQTGLPVTLPSEAEWEKAARGEDGRLWPWGDVWDPKRCNSAEGEAGTTTLVGQYSPLGDSPYGCADMVGNVWEWTRSLWGKDWYEPEFKYPYEPGDGRENLDDRRHRVLRGGSFFNNQWVVRCAYRDWYNPLDWIGNVGFRVVVAPVPSDL
jgi:formylglycine-generating enzyme required for sulfatase activity